MPERKLEGAAASNVRLKVTPPDVTATMVPGPSSVSPLGLGSNPSSGGVAGDPGGGSEVVAKRLDQGERPWAKAPDSPPPLPGKPETPEVSVASELRPLS